MRIRGWAGAALVLGLAGCAAPAGTPPSADVAPGPVAASLQVGVTDDSVRFNLYVTNTSETAVVLNFPSSQRYDFAVETTGGEVIWRWSAARSFAQAIGQETLGPGESLQYEAAWAPDRPRSGTYVAVGELTSTPLIARRMQFQLP